jgi:hypothetical protein
VKDDWVGAHTSAHAEVERRTHGRERRLKIGSRMATWIAEYREASRVSKVWLLAAGARTKPGGILLKALVSRVNRRTHSHRQVLTLNEEWRFP